MLGEYCEIVTFPNMFRWSGSVHILVYGVSMKFNPTESMLLENFIVCTLSYGVNFSTYSYYRIDEIHKRQENQNCFLHQS